MRRGFWGGAVAALVLAIPMGAVSGDGRIEINQESVLASGGFPFLISNTGSYVLTSDLVVSTDDSAILLHGPLLAGRSVSLDLNGFAIVGASSCSVGACPGGSASGIGPFAGFAGRVTVRNGAVRGFSGVCVSLASDSAVEDVLVSSCGRDGIVADMRSVVLRNRVSSTGQRGINMGAGTTFAHNTVSNVNLSAAFPGIDFPAVEGGSATAGNFCDDGSCSRVTRRRFYATTATFVGADADDPGNCADGFHFASLWEIFAPSDLKYDSSLGAAPTSGPGPVSGLAAWIHTGNSDSAANQMGRANCNGWSSIDVTDKGSVVVLGTNTSGSGGNSMISIGFWDSPSVASSPWIPGYFACNQPRPIWCVED